MFRAFADGRFKGGGLDVACALGKGGVIAASLKREGDGGSPAGVWPLRRVLYRADKGPAPQTALPVHVIEPTDGWCDDPADAAYNRPVTLPYPASHERLWRDDHVYDIVVVLGHNDDPVTAGAGSAIFWHLAWPDFRPTEGCVAIEADAMRRALASARPGDTLEIVSACAGDQ